MLVPGTRCSTKRIANKDHKIIIFYIPTIGWSIILKNDQKLNGSMMNPILSYLWLKYIQQCRLNIIDHKPWKMYCFIPQMQCFLAIHFWFVLSQVIRLYKLRKMLMDVQRVCLALWIPLFSIAKLRQKDVFWTGDSHWTWVNKIIRSQMSWDFWKEKDEQMPKKTSCHLCVFVSRCF